MQKVNFLIKSLANKGRMLAKDFIRKRIINNEILFKNSIKKNINKNTFERKSYAKVLICCVGRQKVIAVNKNILARRVSYFKSSGKVLAMQKFSDIHFQLYHSVLLMPMKQWINVRKQMLFNLVAIKYNMFSTTSVSKCIAMFFLWRYAWYCRYVWSLGDISGHSETYEALAWQIISYISSGYKREDLLTAIMILR